jgi:hypothetical protein
MKRIHLFELEDQTWFPASLRNYGTDFLQFLSNKTGMFEPLVPLLAEALTKSQSNTMVDLGSGGGGGLIRLNQSLRTHIPELRIILTDYFPNIDAFEYTCKQAENFEFKPESVDARNVPSSLKGFRTLFLAFHHFKPKDAASILQNAVDANTGIGVFEAQERSFTSILAMLFSPITLFFCTPFIRPFKLGRIVFTYLIPLVPLFVLWDGLVSSLRTYSVNEMNQLIQNLKNSENFEWNVAKIKSGPSKVLYLIGRPIKP